MVRLALLFAALATASLAPVSCAKRDAGDPAPSSDTASANTDTAANKTPAAAETAEPAQEPADEGADGNSEPRPGLEAPGHLPPLARRLLHEQMLRHGDHAESLLWATLMLDHESTQEIAGWVASEVTIARPMKGHEDALNSMLPAAFFDRQDSLRETAKRLADAARARDDAALGKAYGELAETCIACHSLYLRLPPPDEADTDGE